MISAKDMWNAKFNSQEYMYTKEPNEFLKLHIDKLEAKKNILFLGEGEGRNAVYAAKQNHNVTALDASDVGIEKTKLLAKENQVDLKTICADLNNYELKGKYDVVMSSYMHLEEPLRTKVFREAMNVLNKNGLFIGEFFSQNQINRDSGGPKNLDLLYTVDSFKDIFQNHNILHLEEIEIDLNEGKHHRGSADVIRVIVSA
jgi:2-polyprenyl-3-methyl-5-hydroxy-6-metoxy-1,4-benzoquinol methylase